MILHPRTVLGLGDGGAHCGIICDASMTTFMLTHWVRDRRRGPRIPLETAVRCLTRDTAALYGMDDRGVLAPGRKADVNLIDQGRLQLWLPEMAFDLPAGSSSAPTVTLRRWSPARSSCGTVRRPGRCRDVSCGADSRDASGLGFPHGHAGRRVGAPADVHDEATDRVPVGDERRPAVVP